MSIAFVAIIGVFVWLSLDKFIEIISTSNSILEAADRVVNSAGDMLGALDNVCAGSGVIPA